MIKHLIFIFFVLFSLCVLPSCTLFGGDSEEDEGTGEDYYPNEEEQSEESLPQEEDMGEGADSLAENDADSNEDIEYIDEEDEDFLEEDAVVLDESTGSIEEPTDSDGLLDSGVNDGSSDFFDPSNTAGDSAVTQVTPPAPPAKKWVSYKKIKSQPYNSAGFLINAVYIAREGDDMQGVSQKVFGSDQTSQLHAINPHLKVRAIKTGDKIYYPSPHRPQDSQQLLFYFEDKGIPPQYHQVQEGENIRAVASSLLGHKDSWKEIWATNLELESKGQLNQARTIKYWPAGADSQPTEPEEELVEEPQEPSALGGEPEAPSLEGETGASDEDGMLEDAGPTPQPPSSEGGLDGEESSSSSNGEENTSQSLVSGFSQADMVIAGLLALGALILSIAIIKRKWKKKADFDYTAVNYEINE